MIVPPPELTVNELTRTINHLPWTGVEKEALRLYAKAQELQAKNEDTWFKLGLLLYDGGYYRQALGAFKRTSAVSGDSSNKKFGALVWEGHMFDLLGQRDEAIRQYKAALSIEAGQELHHDQYSMTVNRKWVEARIQIPFQRK